MKDALVLIIFTVICAAWMGVCFALMSQIGASAR